MIVYSARISYRGPDALDVTRMTGKEGLIFAPSWTILRPALAARKLVGGAIRCGQLDEARRIEDEAWAEYEPLYLQEMRESYRAHRVRWQAHLCVDERTFVCYCAETFGVLHCHRRLLVGIFVALGATNGGERC